MTKKLYVDVFVFLLWHIYKRHLHASPPVHKMFPILLMFCCQQKFINQEVLLRVYFFSKCVKVKVDVQS